jgi:Flp pilus assembly protein TadD
MTQDLPPRSTAALDAAIEHQRAGRLAEAERLYAEILRRDTGNLRAAHELGIVQLGLGRADAAEASFARALQIAPNHVNALVNRGTALKALNRLDEAESCYRAAIGLDPRNRIAVRNLGILLNLVERHAESLAAADEALARDRHAEGLIMRGDALYGLGRFEEALESYREAAKLSAEPYETLIKTAIARAALRQYTEALALLDQAVALRPADQLAYYQRAAIRLLTCDFEGGWRDFEYRWRNELFIATSSAAVSPQVRERLDLRQGIDDVRGAKVLLVAEQGIGDQVMFASMIPDLAAAAASVATVCDPRLLRLFSNSFEGVGFFDPNGASLPRAAFDKVIAMGSLGHIFRNRLNDFPGAPYLRPSAEVRERWAARLGPRPTGLRIGLSWRGGTLATGAGQRSLALADFAPLLDLPDCDFVSLQYGDPSAEVQAVNADLQQPIRIFPPTDIDDFEELAGLIANLDVVVSVQTSVVHLTGALGTECLILVPYNPIWRYTAHASTMPWYRSAQIHRQAEPGAWASVIARVAEDLKARVRSPART